VLKATAKSSSSAPASSASKASSRSTASIRIDRGPSKTWLKIKNPAAPGVTRFEKENV
jgi:hypothetical protein